ADNEALLFKVCNMYCNNREDREDLFQDIILQLWRAYPGFKGDSKITTWMYRIGINNAITRLRKEKKMEKFGELNEEALQVAYADHNTLDEQIAQMHEAIKKLNDVDRAI